MLIRSRMWNRTGVSLCCALLCLMFQHVILFGGCIVLEEWSIQQQQVGLCSDLDCCNTCCSDVIRLEQFSEDDFAEQVCRDACQETFPNKEVECFEEFFGKELELNSCLAGISFKYPDTEFFVYDVFDLEPILFCCTAGQGLLIELEALIKCPVLSAPAVVPSSSPMITPSISQSPTFSLVPSVAPVSSPSFGPMLNPTIAPSLAPNDASEPPSTIEIEPPTGSSLLDEEGNSSTWILFSAGIFIACLSIAFFLIDMIRYRSIVEGIARNINSSDTQATDEPSAAGRSTLQQQLHSMREKLSRQSLMLRTKHPNIKASLPIEDSHPCTDIVRRAGYEGNQYSV